MSALQKVLECEDLRGIIRAYQQPHPVATIVEDEFLNMYQNEMSWTTREIMNSVRVIVEEKNYEEEEANISKGIPVVVGSKMKSVHFSFEEDAPTENYCSLKYWAFRMIISDLKTLRYVQEGLGFNQTSFFEIFKHNDKILCMSKMTLSILIKDHLTKIGKKYSGDLYNEYYNEYKEREYEIYNSFPKSVIEDYEKIRHNSVYEIYNLHCDCEGCYEEASWSESEDD